MSSASYSLLALEKNTSHIFRRLSSQRVFVPPTFLGGQVKDK